MTFTSTLDTGHLKETSAGSSASFLGSVISDPNIGPIGKEGKGNAPFFVWLSVLLLCHDKHRKQF